MKKVILFTAVFVPAVVSSFVLVSNHNVSIVKENIWSIGIYEGSSPVHFFDPSSIVNPVLEASDVTDVKASFVADPFLYRYNDTWYLFFEVMNETSKHGDIGLAVSKDGKSWVYDQIVLNEEYHLSYPYVFQHDSVIYMIPESATANKLKLYKAVNFPYQWESVCTLLEGKFGDHGLINHNDTWYLFANSEPYKHNTLRLFYSESLTGSWTEHPMSPIVADNANKARPGGRVIRWNGLLIRYTQDCSPTYGKALNAYEIIELTKSEYSEREYQQNPVLKNGANGWTRHGMHHLDPHQVGDDKWIASVDGYFRQFIIKVDF